MRHLKGRVAALTGAASGIGRALAVELAGRGMKLAISDIDREGLAQTAARIEEAGGEVFCAEVDVSDREAVYAWADRVVETFGFVHLIVNNAGVSVTASVEALEYEDFEWIMSINFWGVVYGTKAFLPHLRAADRGHVVNISSILGIVSYPCQAAYSAAKFGVRGFTESLRAELEHEDSTVSATCVHPGGVKTGIARDSRVGSTGAMDQSREELIAEFEEQLARLSPEEAARQIIKGIRRDRRRVLVGNDARLIDFVQRVIPSGYLGALARLLRLRNR